MAKFIDLTGKKYNKLTALEYIRYPRESGRWLCECECGRKIEVKSYDLTHNKVKSCGYTSCGVIKLNLCQARNLDTYQWQKKAKLSTNSDIGNVNAIVAMKFFAKLTALYPAIPKVAAVFKKRQIKKFR